MQTLDDEFADVFGDQRLTQRCHLLAHRLWAQLQASVTQACQGWAEVMAAFRFFENHRVTLATILEGHRRASLARVQQIPEVLAIQDTTDVAYPQRKITGLGPLTTPTFTGLLWHMTFLVTPDRVPLGVWTAETLVRQALGRKKSGVRKQEPIEKKESGRWLRGYHAACSLQHQAPQTRVISIADREGDIYEIFATAHSASQGAQNAADWLIRTTGDRVVLPSEGGRPQSLRLVLALAPVLATGALAVAAAPGRRARLAQVQLKTVTVTLRPPYRKDRKLPPVTLTVVVLREQGAPPEETPLQWMLLTSLPMNGVTDACALIARYAARWDIEVFFRTWKTGCRIEALQLMTRERLEPCLGLYAVLTWRVLYLSRLARACPDLPASLVLSPEELQAIAVLALHPRYGPPPLQFIGQAIRALARLGGFLERTSDGEPGVETLWRGIGKIAPLITAWANAHIFAGGDNGDE